jgi:glycosyltransferase involved in cell wall biosynthesis
MAPPKVSVIIPAYNRAHLLGTAIESVLGQSFGDLEVLVVDDGSTDDTAALVRRYQEKDARVCYLPKEHRGISPAMNAGIRAARGQFIARIDSDDQWLPDMLETEVAILEARPEIGFVYAKGQWCNSDLVPYRNTVGHAPHFPGDRIRSMLWGDPTCNITVVARRECFDRAGFFDESLQSSEDWDMWLRTAYHYEFVFVDRVVALIRAHGGNLTGAQAPSFAAFLDSRHKVLDSFFSRSDLPPRVVAMKPVAYRNLYVFEGNMWAGTGNWRRALRAFLRAFQEGGNRFETMGRIVWFSLVHRIIIRTAAGRKFLDWDSSRRQRLRTRNSI